MTTALVDRYCQHAGLNIALSAVVHGALVEHQAPRDLPPEMLRRAARALAPHDEAMALELQRIASAGSKPRRGGARTGAGRPPRAPGKRVRLPAIDCTEDEHRVIAEAADAADMTISDYVRTSAVANAKRS